MDAERGVRRAAATAAVVWMAVIFALSSLPGSAVPGRFGNAGHFVLYAVLGGLYSLALPHSWRPWITAMTAVVLASLYGASDEFHQSFVPGRTPDVMDWVIDTAGALSAALAVLVWRLRRPERDGAP
ncbi:MAG: VanZ family protein [Coriobacteriia bacterium]